MSDSNATKKVLADAMKDLMAREPFAKISVGDICQHCGMNRKSFYYHFRDKYDLVNWIFDTEFLQSVRASDFPTGWDLLERMCGYFYQEQAFYRCAMQIQGQNSFREYFCEVLTPFLTSFAQDLFPDRDDMDFFVTFFSDALLVSLIRWLSGGVRTTAEEYVGELKRVVLGMARHILSQETGGPAQV